MGANAKASIAGSPRRFCCSRYDAEKGDIVTVANGDVHDSMGRPTESGHLAAVDPMCQMMAMHLYDGLLKVVPMKGSGLEEAFNLRLEELSVKDIQFLYNTTKPTVVVIHEDPRETRYVKTYEINLKDKDISDGSWTQCPVDPSASMLIPVPGPYGGAIVVGESTVSYLNGSAAQPKTVALPKLTVMKSYGRIDPDGTRHLLADWVGQIYVCVLIHDGAQITGIKVERVGEANCASTLSYLDNGVVYLGSSGGDSQLLLMKPEPDENGGYIEVLENYGSIGPVVDFVVVDLEKQGQGQVVTCSGAMKDGSLRIIRNGIGINEQAQVELPSIKGMWSLRPSSTVPHDKYLVVSFVGETRLLAIEDEELGETEIPGFDAGSQSLLCANMPNDRLLQVTAQSVRLVDTTSLALVGSWAPPTLGDHITLASAAPTGQIAVVVGGKNLFYLEIEGDSFKTVAEKAMPHEISCLDISPVHGERATFCAVGTWVDISLRLLQLPDFKELVLDALGGEVIPRSVLLCPMEGVPRLLCALGDGQLVTYVVAEDGTLSERKKVSLGTQPILLNSFHSKNSTNVLAASDRPTVIYSHKKKLMYSNLNLKDATCMCSFNSASFPESLAIASEESMMIGTIDDIQKLHIRTVPLGEQPRRITHMESVGAFGVCTIRVEEDPNGEEAEKQFFKLIDDQTFEVLHDFEFDDQEYVLSCMAAPLGLGAGEENSASCKEYFVVGTGLQRPDESEPKKGRILVFTASDGKLDLVHECDVRGGVHDLQVLDGGVLAAINSKVMLYRWKTVEDGLFSLQEECSHHGHITALFLKVRGDFVVVGDIMKSICLLRYKHTEKTLEEIGRDSNSNWITAIEILDDDTFLGTENRCNIFTLKKNADAATDEERNRLEVVGEYHIGEYVNKFRHGSLRRKVTEAEDKYPTVLFGTVNGCIGVLAQLPQEQYQFLTKVQGALTKVVKGVGGLDHAEWRSFSSMQKQSKARNFIDGDLIESFLMLEQTEMEKVVEAVGGTTLDDVTKLIEELTQLH